MMPIRDEQNIDAIETFISEARTYLVSIKGYSDALLHFESKSLTPEQQNGLQQIQQAVEALQDLCSRLLLEAHNADSHQ